MGQILICVCHYKKMITDREALGSRSRILHFLSKLLLRREIDFPFFSFFLRALTLLITAVALFAVPEYTLYILPVHVAIYLYFLGPFITMFHDINHSPLFRGRLLNKCLTDGFGLLYGSTPKTYFTHHVIMHHPENNELTDLSTTLPFQRDSFKDFSKYYISFFFCLFSLSRYLKASGNKTVVKYANGMVYSEIIYILVTVVLLWVNPVATFGVLILPLIVTRSLLIIGNWGEHAFIDPVDPGNLYKNSTNLVGIYNKDCFNVGYHIGHHIRPSLHFTLLEKDFNDHIDRYSREDAVVFTDLHYPHVWYYLMTGNYAKLASKFVHLPGRENRRESEVVDFLKRRVVPIGRRTQLA